MTDFKPRDRHQGIPAPHLGQDHLEKDALDDAAGKIDQGPTFGTPGDPPGADPDSVDEIAGAFDDLDREDGVPRAG